MNQTPKSKKSIGRGVVDAAPSPPKKTPAPSAGKGGKKRARVGGKKVLEPVHEESEGEHQEEVEDDLEEVNLLSKTIRHAQLQKNKTKAHAQAVVVEEAAVAEEAGVESQAEDEEKSIKKEVEILSELCARYADRLTTIEMKIAVLEVSGTSKVDNAEAWILSTVAENLAKNKCGNFDDTRCLQATNKSYTYNVSSDLLGICLHCLHAGRKPESCLFLRGRNGVKMHRTPPGKRSKVPACVKAGVPDMNDPNFIQCRMVNGKDYIEVKFPAYDTNFELEAENDVRPGVYDEELKKWRNMTGKEYDEYKKIPGVKKGSPNWQILRTWNANNKATASPGADYRSILKVMWDKLLATKGWVLGKEWEDEAADFKSELDQEAEDDEKKKTLVLDNI